MRAFITNLIKLSFATCITVIIASCATMFDGTTQTISIDSVPKGANVYVAARSKKTGQLVRKTKIGVTPLQVEVPRKDGVVLLEAEGYETIEAPLVRGTNPKIWLDVLATSLLSTSIDASTGAMHRYNPGEYLVELQPLP